MSFADTTKQQNTVFKKAEYIELPQGRSVIRILNESAIKKMIHYVRRVSLECLGEDCPICMSNGKIIRDNPENFRQAKSYYPRRPRFFCNVLDRTPVKLCPKCGKANKAINNVFPMVCGACQENIVPVAVRPLEKIKVLIKGPELFEQFNGFETNMQNEKGEPMRLQDYDFILNVSGTGQETKTQAIPLTSSNDVVSINEEDLFDLEEVGSVKLTPNEMLDFLKGVNLKDIYNTRKLERAEKDEDEDEPLDEEADDLANQIADEILDN